jgi:hypothetical protein
MVLALRLVFCTELRTDSDFFCIRHEVIGFYNLVESVYNAVQTDALYKPDYVSSFKGQRVNRRTGQTDKKSTIKKKNSE